MLIINFIFYSFIIAILNISNKVIKKYKIILHAKIENINLKRRQLLLHGVTSLYENKLLSMGTDDFANWCKNYLISIGYRNVEIIENDIVTICCYKNYKKFFVLCFKKNTSKNDENEIFDYYYILLGEMLSRNITNGIILSIDGITKNFTDYLTNFPYNDINIDLQDKNTIIDNCLKFKINI